MAGVNRASDLYRNLSETRKNRGIECVFLSHQQRDKNICREIANYIRAANIDVYFDEDDKDLKLYRQENNPSGVVESIKKGINNSSHMLVIISPNTLVSKWVPWEVGYGYDKTDLGILTIKGISDEALPDYLKTTAIIRGTKSLNSYLAKIARQLQIIMESADLVKSHTMSQHPLDNFLDWNK